MDSITAGLSAVHEHRLLMTILVDQLPSLTKQWKVTHATKPSFYAERLLFKKELKTNLKELEILKRLFLKRHSTGLSVNHRFEATFFR